MLREKAGTHTLDVELPAPTSGTDLLQHLCSRFPHLTPYRSSIRLARNEEYVPDQTVLNDGDEIALITPVSGG